MGSYLRSSVHRVVVLSVLTGVAFSIGASAALATTVSRAGATTIDKKVRATTVNVVLGDTQGLNGPMTLTVNPASVKAGKVKFVVKNNGTIVHELVVLKTTTPFDQLPIADAGDPPAPVASGANKVSEAAKAGETGDIDSGKTKSVTLKLSRGTYVLVCNIAQHYGLGMRAALTVT